MLKKSSRLLVLFPVSASLIGTGAFGLQGELELEPKKPVVEDPPPPPPPPPPEDWPVDPKTAQRILDFLNGVSSDGEITAVTGVDAATAQQILAIRGKLDGSLASLYDLNEVWSTSFAAFSQFHSVFGPAAMGMWETMPYDMPFSPAHSIMLHTGLVLLFPESNSTQTTQWDPTDEVTGTFINPDNSPAFSQFCSHHAQLSDGRILAAGGGGGSPSINSDQAHIFDPDAGTNGVWTQISDMNFERWYPTVVNLGYPNMLIVGGRQSNGQTAEKIEMYNELTGNFTVVSGPPADPDGADFDWPPLYAGLHQVPTGQILFTRTGFSGNSPLIGTQYFEWTDFTNPTTGVWTDTNPLAFPNRTDGISIQILTPTNDILEQKARVAVFGGGQSSVPTRVTAEILDAENLALGPTWTRLPDMAEPRHHCQGVALPDGQLLIYGGADHGNNGMVGSFTSELFDPSTDTFSLGDSMQYARGYHSVAALLPSGKVMASGGISGALERKIEVYSPPYLFRGPRPTITSAPSLVHHGNLFDVVTPDVSQIDKVVLVRPIAYTHQTDSEQRVLQLPFTRDVAGGKVTATAPDAIHPHPHAPRGYYMLFILDCDGVPSEGQFVHLH